MNLRQEKIIRLLQSDGGWIKGKDIALIMGVSARTIRSDIEAINTSLQNGTIESSFQKGYHLTMAGKEGYQSSDIPQTVNERRAWIVKKLFLQKEINILDLPEQVYASSYTIDADLKAIKKELNKDTPLRLVTNRNWISLEGEESDKRRYYKLLLSAEVDDNFMNIDRMNALYPEFDLYLIRDILEQAIEHQDFQIRETAMPMLLMHIGIALQRQLRFQTIDKSEDMRTGNISELPEYHASEEFWNHIASVFPIEVSSAEVDNLALLLMGRRSQNFTDEQVEYKGNPISISKLVDEISETIHQIFGIDIRTDHELEDGLALHLRALIKRLNTQTQVENVYLNEIRWRFPLIFDMGVTAANVICSALNTKLDENEIGFFALHLGAAYNRAIHKSKYRAVIVFPNDQALSQLVVDKIQHQFSDRMEIVACTNTFENQKMKYWAPDLILTSLPLSHDIPVPTVFLSVFYDQKNETDIFLALNQLDKERNRKIFERDIKKLIVPQYFYTQIKADSVNEVIEKMCEPLIADEYVPKEYAQAVLERETFAPTSFYMGYALPHALNQEAYKSAISIAWLEKPLRWGNYDVFFVLLLSIRDEDRDLLRIFFDWWTQIVSNRMRYLKLMEKRTYASFMHALLEDE